MKAVLFDLDGTLHDRNATIRDWLEVHRQEFALPEAYTARFLELDDYGYRGKREVMTRLVEELGLPHAVDTLLDTYWRHLNHARVMPHTHEVLNELRDRGIRVGIVTNGWQEAQSRCLQGCQLEGLADDVVISKVVGLSKPDPAIYRLALERLGAEVQSTWFVGDSPRNDIWGPQQIGLRAAWLPTGHALGEETPDTVLGDLRDVLALD
ncbi:hypothetical protein GCM10008955_04370 [Deinococcus malanensis]|uniref:HAD family hydrolase n=1 Tax=Deinococcus malanensis TaxID=1706855 RepID=A0ABQ2EJV5_9DEIO|nr:HAD family hydrolase [Deinococcus malanensis]GGK14157.1 hypothetical protein GCM10008955_04370 [Deinococcus malanensis]